MCLTLTSRCSHSAALAMPQHATVSVEGRSLHPSSPASFVRDPDQPIEDDRTNHGGSTHHGRHGRGVATSREVFTSTFDRSQREITNLTEALICCSTSSSLSLVLFRPFWTHMCGHLKKIDITGKIGDQARACRRIKTNACTHGL